MSNFTPEERKEMEMIEKINTNYVKRCGDTILSSEDELDIPKKKRKSSTTKPSMPDSKPTPIKKPKQTQQNRVFSKMKGLKRIR